MQLKIRVSQKQLSRSGTEKEIRSSGWGTPPERRVPESPPNFLKISNLMPGWARFWVSGWIAFYGVFGLRIERNKSLNWMVFRYAPNGATPDLRFRGTHFQQSKTCEKVTKPKPTRESKYFYTSNNTSNHF